MVTTPSTTAHENRLIHETSPYLLQHAHNPVDWYPWGTEALERARTLHRPLLVSIGYSACHWCHVMERESFEDPEIAAAMNRGFVCVKVDREERPDLDALYMNATVAMSGAGGWPMTVFLTPEQEPFFAGTYFPPTARYGRPGFLEVLEQLDILWRTAPERAIEQGRALREALAVSAKPAAPAGVGQEAIDEAVAALSASFDPTHGGFGGAPKFPAPAAISLLLRHHVRTGDLGAKRMAALTLDAMACGGIYDHLGGGFARYSTDTEWLVPHFEKMLYDNAQLARVYLEGHQVTHDPRHARVARETLDYVLHEMQSPTGGFYSATDADSEGVEGKFFVFTKSEIVEELGEDDARAFCAYYDVTEAGNWEGKNILHTPRSLASVARELGMKAELMSERIEASRERLYALRARRVPPALDDKVLTSWNGLMIGTLAEGARVLGEERYLEGAARAADDLLERMRRDDGGLYRTARAGRAHIDGFLDDYAYLADALLDLYEAGGERRYLEEATRLAERILTDFREPRGGGFYFSALDSEALIVRHADAHDDATPSAVAVAARLLARLSFHLDRPRFREIAEEALRAHGGRMGSAPRAYCTALAVVDFLLGGPVEVVLAGDRADPDLRALARESARRPLPNRVVGWVDRDTPAEVGGLLEGRAPHDGPATAYVCRRFVCRAPVQAPGPLGHALDAAMREAARERRGGLEGLRLPGHATVERTRAFAARFEAQAEGYVPFGATGLSASRLGFGGYRVSDASDTQRAALMKALRLGVNVIDTSTNYMDGGSERLVGEVLAELVRAEELARDQIIVVTKAGYLQGSALASAKARAEEGAPFEEIVEVDEALWHCLHPSFLEASLDASLARLGLETVDFLLLHNPEYLFEVAGDDLEETRGVLYGRLEAAFRHLEREVERGRIAGYGLSSNTLARPADASDAVDLGRVLAAATAAGGVGHHLRVIELPMNLLESEAYFERAALDNGHTVLEEARARGLAVLVNRPLNAVGDGHLFRLADPPLYVGGASFEDALEAVEELEAEYREQIAPRLELPSGADPADLFRWAERLGDIVQRLDAGADWKRVEAEQIRPELDERLSALDRAGRYAPDLAPLWQEFRRRYVPAVRGLLGAVSAHVAMLRRGQTAGLRALLAPSMSAQARVEPLSQLAVHVLASTPGVTTVLVGMREPAYVDDLLPVMAARPLDGWEAILTRGPVSEPASDE